MILPLEEDSLVTPGQSTTIRHTQLKYTGPEINIRPQFLQKDSFQRINRNHKTVWWIFTSISCIASPSSTLLLLDLSCSSIDLGDWTCWRHFNILIFWTNRLETGNAQHYVDLTFWQINLKCNSPNNQKVTTPMWNPNITIETVCGHEVNSRY